MLPVRILLCIVTAEAQVKVLADVAVDSAAHNEAPAVVAGVFHVDHFMIIFMTLRLGTTWYRKYSQIEFRCGGVGRRRQQMSLSGDYCVFGHAVWALIEVVFSSRCFKFFF